MEVGPRDKSGPYIGICKYFGTGHCLMDEYKEGPLPQDARIIRGECRADWEALSKLGKIRKALSDLAKKG